MTVYDSNNIKNTVVNGKTDEEEIEGLKKIVNQIKAK